MSDQFTCVICGNEHVGLPTDWAYKLPDEIWKIPETERNEAAQFNDDLCKFGERRFIRCVLEIPFTDQDGFFGWGAWAEVDQEAFEQYLALYDADGRVEPRKHGRLANDLAAYRDNMIGHPALIQFREASKRPSLHLSDDDTSAIAVEQRQGIDGRRYHEILEQIGA